MSGVPSGIGPSDEVIATAVREFAEKFNYWYGRVMKEAIGKYRDVVVGRINPFIRRVQYEGLTCKDFTARIVEDYDRRNFVTAGGWALEILALSLNPEGRKSAAQGIDLQIYDVDKNEHNLYIIKSGTVTRNSDIVSALKTNLRAAERILRQNRSTGRITLNWAVAAGKNSSTFEDGIRRPSSAAFWSEVTGLPQDQAIDLASAVIGEAGKLIRSDVLEHIRSLEILVCNYIEDPCDPRRVDWKFLNRRSFFQKSIWVREDIQRHGKATAALRMTGHAEFLEVVEESSQTQTNIDVGMEDSDTMGEVPT